MLYNVYCDETCHLEHDGINVMVLGAVWCPQSKLKEINQRINSFRNGYTISDLLKMNLSIYAIKVGKTTLDMLDVNKELGMNVSIIPKDNPSYEGQSEEAENVSTAQVLDVFDVLLAGVEADD